MCTRNNALADARALSLRTVLVLRKLKKNKRNRTATATHRFKVFCDI